MRILNRIFTILLTATIVLCQMPISQNASAESENKKKRIIVSLGDSYSSGEGISPFYGQEIKTYDSVDDIKNNLDWLAHRSTLAWSGQLVLDGLKMSEHPDNWYFEAVSGAEIKHLGVDDSYQNNAYKIIEKRQSKKLKAGTSTVDDVMAERSYMDYSELEKENQTKTVSYIEIKADDNK